MQSNLSPHRFYLKSNMDRFIVRRKKLDTAYKGYLKSNMDRFIAINSIALKESKYGFKIQYG